QAVGNQGPIYIKVPYSLAELEQWKTPVGKYRENPDKVANLVERAINTQNLDWADLKSMMDTLLDLIGRQTVNKAITTSVEAQLEVYGLKHGVPKALNWSKIYEVKQNYDESPTDFLNRLREAAIKYINLDPDSADEKAYLLFLFM
ncbi:hypothetical protein IHE44_0004809, partial [Lamprotornis superbus]